MTYCVTSVTAHYDAKISLKDKILIDTRI